MTNGTAALTPAPPADHHDPETQDDDTVATPTRGAKKVPSNSQVQEKTLRFRFPVMNGGNCVPPPVLHYHFIAALQEVFGDQIQFLVDNKNCKVGKVDLVRFHIKNQSSDFTWYYSSPNQRTNQDQSESNNPNDRRTVKYVSHRICTTCTMAEIKANPRVKSLLTDHNFFVNFHRWDETEWETMLSNWVSSLVLIRPSYPQTKLRQKSPQIYKQPLLQNHHRVPKCPSSSSCSNHPTKSR